MELENQILEERKQYRNEYIIQKFIYFQIRILKM